MELKEAQALTGENLAGISMISGRWPEMPLCWEMNTLVSKLSA
jgi:hypothetical protein